MKLAFEGDILGLEKGIEIFSKEFRYKVCSDGMAVKVVNDTANKIHVSREDSTAIIKYSERTHFFRALGLLLEAMSEKDEFEIEEEPQFSMNGIMIDVSQGNAVINVDNVKKIIYRMAIMGLNMLMLYVEDSYEVEGEPYFGYMRGRYSQDELREIDDYAYELGVEIIPCIQTLAHLTDALKWECYSDIKDDDTTLLVGCEKTYRFIEKLIASASAPLRSKRIHIGLDEAWKLGQGNYLLKNGYRSKFDIMNEHLDRVMQITAKYGLKPMMWSDMFFRAIANGRYYEKDLVIPQELIRKIPQGMQFVYWDYYNNDEEFYTEFIKKHKKFGSNPIFAGGIWNWSGFGLNYGKTFVTTNSALTACKKEGVKEVFATLWGDDTTESNIYSALLGLQLYAEHGYSKDLDMEKLKKRFKFCTGGHYQDFIDIKYLDEVPGTDPGNITTYTVNPCKYLLWQDILTGLFDKNIEGLDLSGHYENMRKKMGQHSLNNGEFNFVFVFLEKVCSVLAIKAELGLKVTDAYRRKDAIELKRLANEVLPVLAERVNALRLNHRKWWMKINKPFGWEILDLRYGQILMRIDTAISRIKDYIEGNIEKIDELEQERLYFQCKQGLTDCGIYNRMPSASRISATTR